MLPESAYAKLVSNEVNTSAAIVRLRKKRPLNRSVQVLKVTEKQFRTMACIAESRKGYDEMDTMEEFVVL